jgi:hypothetical protein
MMGFKKLWSGVRLTCSGNNLDRFPAVECRQYIAVDSGLYYK